MKHKIEVKKQFIRILSDKSILPLLLDAGLDASEGKTLIGKYETIIRCSEFTRNDIVKTLRRLLEAQDDYTGAHQV